MDPNSDARTAGLISFGTIMTAEECMAISYAPTAASGHTTGYTENMKKAGLNTDPLKKSDALCVVFLYTEKHISSRGATSERELRF